MNDHEISSKSFVTFSYEMTLKQGYNIISYFLYRNRLPKNL